ncbi:MAG: hypothetical protein KJZ85_17315 [Rhodobacteraceae bacterium]|jgi:uncharacterized protein involved in exopolysaccharide biosynthesis|nr:hypothetical protein [Paracoccaceae bacterium]
MGPIQSLDDLVSLLRRRWPAILLVAVLGVGLTLAYAMTRPRVYEATAVIQFESPRVSEADEHEGGTLTPAQRVQLIQQRLMARENLLEVIERHGLFAGLPLSVNEKVAALRASTAIQSVAAAQAGFGSAGQLAALIISVRLGDPVQAADVANGFATAVLDEDARRVGERARAAVAFFTAEEARVGAALAAIEADIAAFKNANEAALPGDLAFRRDELARIGELMRDLQQRIIELRRERDAIAAARPVRAVEQRQIDTLDGQIAALSEQEARLAARRDEIDAALREAPEVERNLSTFERRRGQLQDQYAVVSRRLAEAETALRLYTTREAERLELLERAVVPEYAVGSGRRRIAILGAAASVGLALVAAFLLDLLNPVIRSAAQMERALSLRPVVVIPAIDTPGDVRRRQALRIAALGLLALAFLLAMGMAGAQALR